MRNRELNRDQNLISG